MKTGRPIGACKVTQDLEASGMTLAKFSQCRAIEYARARQKLLYNRQAAIANALGVGVSTAKNYRVRAERGEEPYATLFMRFTAAEEQLRAKELGDLVPRLRKKDPAALMAIFFPDLDPSKIEDRKTRESASRLASAALRLVFERFEAESASADLRTREECVTLLGAIVENSVAAMADG